MGSALVANLDLRSLLTGLAASLRRVTECDFIGLSLQDPSSGNLRLGAVNAEGLTFAQGGSVGDVNLGRIGEIIKPVEVPTDVAVNHSPVTYIVGDNDDLGPCRGCPRKRIESQCLPAGALVGRRPKPAAVPESREG